MPSIGDRLLAALRAAGMEQRELARLSGVHEVSISRFIHGIRKPGVNTLTKLAAALKIPAGALLGDEPEPAETPPPVLTLVPQSFEEAHEAAEEALVRAAELAEGRSDRRARLRRTVTRWAKVITITAAISTQAGSAFGSQPTPLSGPVVDRIHPLRRCKRRELKGNRRLRWVG